MGVSFWYALKMKYIFFIFFGNQNYTLYLFLSSLSEQQYYNAMKRKGYNPREDDVPIILAIHNTVNERAWSQVREWEALAGYPDPKLKRFEGRPKDISPKAHFLNLLGYVACSDQCLFTMMTSLDLIRILHCIFDVDMRYLSIVTTG